MDNEKLYEDMKPKEKFEVLWAESGLADRPGAENLWQQMVDLGFFEKPASIKAGPICAKACWTGWKPRARTPPPNGPSSACWWLSVGRAAAKWY